MKLEYTDGCTSLTVDGKETADMTPEEIKVSIRAMLIEKPIQLLFRMSLIEHLGEYKDLGRCGDWISNYTLEI